MADNSTPSLNYHLKFYSNSNQSFGDRRSSPEISDEGYEFDS